MHLIIEITLRAYDSDEILYEFFDYKKIIKYKKWKMLKIKKHIK